MNGLPLFYRELPKQRIPITKLLTEERFFEGVPKNWHIVITDIEHSSEAVKNGRHEDVNLSATGSIITVLNTLQKIDPNIRVPYFFGGDGATFIIPDTVSQKILKQLQLFSIHVKKTFNLNLRIGNMQVEKVYQNGSSLRIARWKQNEYLTIPVVLGNGLKFAESHIKEQYEVANSQLKKRVRPNLKGMVCRWDEILPEEENDRVFCLLVSCHDETKQAEIFGKILKEIEYIFGNLNERNPISVARLKLNSSFRKIRKEMYMRLGIYKPDFLLKNWLMTKFGKFYFRYFKEGKDYLFRVTQLSDTLMFDGSLNTIIAGNEKQINELKLYLDTMEAAKEIVYGIHCTHASIMSCFVKNRDRNHIHFIDGTEGGYTAAAMNFKTKIRA